MSRKYNKLLLNSGLVLSKPQTRSTSHQKDNDLLLHQKDNISLQLLSVCTTEQSDSAVEESSSIEGSSCGSGHGTMKKQAARIISQIERNSTLMENDPLAEHLRVETLRDMVQSLTVKRTVKAKLTRAVSNKNKTRPIGCCRRFKYWISISLIRLKIQFHDILSSMELWYNSLKTIEGHFGSDVAAYFKFIRWFFIINLIVFIFSFSFIVLPQFMYMEMAEKNGTAPIGDLITSVPGIMSNSIITPAPNSSSFTITDIFTGEGFFTNSTLYYGFYTNKSLSDDSYTYYSIPTAYFFVVLTSYLLIFVTISVSMAKSYRTSFIETSGGLKNVYALKIFCAWDFSIATEKAAILKSESILRDIQKLLDEDLHAALNKPTFLQKLCLLCIRILVNVFIVIMLAKSVVLVFSLLDQSLIHDLHVKTVNLTGFNFFEDVKKMIDWKNKPVLIPVIVTIILIVLPLLFSWIVRFEKYDTKTSLYITMLRTYVLECLIVGVMVVLRLQKDNSECWETSLGQEVYRLVVMDFLLSGLAVTLSEFFRNGLKRILLKEFETSEFDISRNTLNLIYNQSLFWVGFFFSPLLSLVVIIKMFFTFYLKKLSLLYNFVPSKCNWRAAQTQTLFLVLSFISLLVILITNGYIITSLHTSDCGPFKGANYMYEKILEEVFHVQQGNAFWSFIMFLRKPGFVAGLLLSMCGGVYYLRAKSVAQKKMVKILREMLVTEAKDKEYLLKQISFLTGGRKSRPHSEID
ncbi:transmembrane channel-like protein 5 isoform X2 [Lycorma delicatula]